MTLAEGRMGIIVGEVVEREGGAESREEGVGRGGGRR